MCEALNLQVKVANPNHEAWHWKNIKRKTDKDDALKLAQMTDANDTAAARIGG